MATTKSTADRVFDALSEGSAALATRVKSGNDRIGRITAALIAEAEWSQRSALDLGRTFVGNPTDVTGFANAAYQKSGEAEGRAFEFARSLLDEAATASKETRTAVEQVAGAGMQATWPAVEAVRQFVTRTGGALRPEFLRTEAPEPRTPARSTRRTAEEAA